jgi:hypothetical protein
MSPDSGASPDSPPQDEGADLPGLTSVGSRLVGVLAGLLAFAVAWSFALASYFRIDVPASLSFRGDDSWCVTGREGMGLHCWGDYAAIRFRSLSDLPEGPEAPYPMATRIVRAPFMLVESIWGSQVGLALFLLCTVLCLMIPALWAVRRTSLSVGTITVAVACVATTPFLLVVDRGNLVGFAVPALFVVLLGVVRHRPWWAVAGVIAASAVKPQFALLIVLFVSLRQLRPFLGAALGSLLMFGLPFLLLGNNWAYGMKAWRESSVAWAGSQSIAADWPSNLSIASALHGWLTHAGAWIESTGLDLGGWGVEGRSTESVSVVVAYGLVAVIVVLLAWRGNRLPGLALAASLIAMACLVLPVSFAYYGAFALPIIAILLREGLVSSQAHQGRFRVVTLSLAVALVLTLTPILIPSNQAVRDVGGEMILPSLTPHLATAAWLVFLIVGVGQCLGRSTHEPQATASGRLLGQ